MGRRGSVSRRAYERRLEQVPEWRRERWQGLVSELLSEAGDGERVVALVEVLERPAGAERHLYRAQDMNSTGRTYAPREWSVGRLEAIAEYCRQAEAAQLVEVQEPLSRVSPRLQVAR